MVLAATSLATGLVSTVGAQGSVKRVGVLSIIPDTTRRKFYEVFINALRKDGWVEDKNLAFVFAELRGDPTRYPETMAELLRQKVDLVFADSAPAVRAAQAATHAVPIVGHDYANDPVAAGYAKTYARPGGNVTGVFLDAPEFSGKWVGILRDTVPGLSRIAAIWDPSPGDTHLRALEGIARGLNLGLEVIEVRKVDDIDGAAFRTKPQALIVLSSPMTWLNSDRLAKLAMKERLPAISIAPHFAGVGGLLNYGPKLHSVHERLAALIGRILRGEKPGDLPIERPTTFEFIINLKTAKALGLSVPDAVQKQADRLIL